MSVRLGVLALSVSLLLLTMPLALGAGSYDIHVAESTDVPDRTVTVEGDEYEITSVSTLQQGATIDAEMSAPSDSAAYDVLLYNSDRQIEKSTDAGEGDHSVQFSTDELTPGSYVLVVDDGGIQAVHPFVIQGYDVTVDAPTTVAPGDSVDVTVELTPHEDSPDVEAVDVALADDEVVTETTATADGEYTYTAKITAPKADGEYDLGATVRGPDDVHSTDRKEVVAVSDPTGLTVQTSDENTDESRSSDPSGPSEEPTESATPTATDSVTPTETDSSTPTETTPTAATPTTSDTPSETTDADGPITPDRADESTEEVPQERGGLGADGPGFGSSAAILGLLGGAELVRRRR